jgi:XTP/dITP diphosphohydrolase
MDLVIASNNANKVREIKQILGDRFTLYTMAEKGLDIEIEETGDTFEANALIKARTVCQATGCVSIADDSGLCVQHLGGAPGIYSARYAGEAHDDSLNRRKLLTALADCPDERDRQAYFATSIVLYYPDGKYLAVEGRVDGYILHAETGDNGFGYDSLFFSYDLGKCFGVCTAAEKNSVSHRARALRKLVSLL